MVIGVKHTMLGFPLRKRPVGLRWRSIGMLMFQLSMAAAIHAQPGPDHRTFYRTRIQHSTDANEQLRAITELRRQLLDTADLEDERQRHPSRIARQQEALFLNFLCYVHEARITSQGTCVLQLGFRNYDRMEALGPVDAYPSAAEQQQAITEARYLERDLCLRAFERNGNRLDDLPPTACGCSSVLAGMLQQAEEQRRADEATAGREEATRVALRTTARSDSIQRAELARKPRLSAAIYAPNGTLRCDMTYRIATASIDGLNTALFAAMFTASNAVFVMGPEAERNWELMADVVQEERPLIWHAKARKQGDHFLLEDLAIGDFISNIRARLYSELYLSEVAPFVKDGEVLVVPYRVVLDPSLSDRNVRVDAADGYVNIHLRQIPQVDVKD